MRVSISLLCAAAVLALQQVTAFMPPAAFPSSSRPTTALRMAAEAVEVPMELIKKLRGMSGAPIMDCKKALAEEKLDVEAAFDWLRKKGQATIAKRDRATKEGLVSLAVEGTRGVAVEVNSETDFVARNADFQAFVAGATKTALSMTAGAAAGVGSMERDALMAAKGPTGDSIETELANLVAKIREGMTLRRASQLVVDQGVVACYVHNAAGPLMGQAGALVGIKTDATGEKLEQVEAMAKRLAMHVVAANPLYLNSAAVPAEVVEREKAVARQTAIDSGKKPEVVEKMTEGRLRKYFEEVCLVQQNHMLEEGNPK
ncbi:hypothetical protein VYU27_007246, partial [Nannochloropsis oceanica]